MNPKSISTNDFGLSGRLTYVVQRECGRVDIFVQHTIDSTLAVFRVSVDRSREDVVGDFLPVSHGEQTRGVIGVQKTTHTHTHKHTHTPSLG